MQSYENPLIFKGGNQNPDWNAMPLWTAVQIEALFWPSPSTQMIRWLRKQIERQEAPLARPSSAQVRP
jgi:hypothetical protein